jgi:hypothetical protein
MPPVSGLPVYRPQVGPPGYRYQTRQTQGGALVHVGWVVVVVVVVLLVGAAITAIVLRGI